MTKPTNWHVRPAKTQISLGASTHGPTTDLNCYIKVLKVKPVYQQMTLSPKLGVVGISTLWHFRLLKKRGKDNRLLLLCKDLKGKASITTDDLIPKTRRGRNQHSKALQTPTANTDVYKGSFFPQTIRDWNALPDSLISSAENAEDCVAKFTSLVRARD